MGGRRVEAEGSLFEVCGERHQRERREASRARETKEGPPSAQAHLDLPFPPAPAPSLPPPAARDWPEV